MTDPMHDRCPALEPGTGERCVLYAKHISDRSGVHVATGSWPVEGSTPLDSPAPRSCAAVSWPSDEAVRAGTFGACVLAPDAHKLSRGVVAIYTTHRDEHGNEWDSTSPAEPARAGEVVDQLAEVLAPAAVLETLREQLAAWRSADQEGYDPGDLAEAAETLLDAAPDMRSRRQGGRGAVAQADEPALVPLPVDALLKLIAEYGQHTNDEAHAVDDAGYFASGTFRQIEIRIEALWATGVEEGRRQLDAEIHANAFTSARLAAAEAGFAPAPESVTVSYERRASAYEQAIYDEGTREGRRQATEERARQHADGPDAALARLVGPVLIQVAAERMRQDARWGEQNHPDGTNLNNAEWRDHSRDLTEVAAKQGRVTWAHILQEEFVETLAEVEPGRIRAELIQTAAVAVAWIQAIDRRPDHG